MAKINTKPLRGIRDFLPLDVLRHDYVINVIDRVYQKGMASSLWKRRPWSGSPPCLANMVKRAIDCSCPRAQTWRKIAGIVAGQPQRKQHFQWRHAIRPDRAPGKSHTRSKFAALL